MERATTEEKGRQGSGRARAAEAEPAGRATLDARPEWDKAAWPPRNKAFSGAPRNKAGGDP